MELFTFFPWKVIIGISMVNLNSLHKVVDRRWWDWTLRIHACVSVTWHELHKPVVQRSIVPYVVEFDVRFFLSIFPISVFVCVVRVFPILLLFRLGCSLRLVVFIVRGGV